MHCNPPLSRDRVHCPDHRRGGDICSNLCVRHHNAKVQELVELLKEADEYLNINHMTNIAHGSILHRKFQEAVAENKE